MANYSKTSVADAERVELHDQLGLTGAEVSINILPAGASVPFVHSHKENEEIYAIDPEQIDQLRELIASTDRKANYDSDIFEIVSQEAAAFFQGQKSAEDVAKLIQSKANIFVNEQR